ncbi:TadE/TadG family type IV pilus assembly protein [Methylosinus sp. Sm6]|uniref:TadE/TadG family type IV pilus assembly protein n=1 Tax=Methylosinus sp. Sm6 TaxID=2866948 RepID=UPI0021028893|nr:TadE/TadG family type IV pilus assembly protein [Methylosinus sp. Sm6]
MATCRRGVAAVEFAFIALPLLALLVAIVQIGIVFLAQDELETATEKAARTLLTGHVQQNSSTRDEFIATVCANLPALFECSGVMVDLRTANAFSSLDTSTPVLTFDRTGNVTNNWLFETGGAGAIMVLRVIYQFPVVNGPLRFHLANLPGGKRLLASVAVFKVEPYSTTGL